MQKQMTGGYSRDHSEDQGVHRSIKVGNHWSSTSESVKNEFDKRSGALKAKHCSTKKRVLRDVVSLM